MPRMLDPRPLVLGSCLIIASLACCTGAQDGPPSWPTTGTRPGQVFPTLVFPTLADGDLSSIAAFRGRKVLLIQFASW